MRVKLAETDAEIKQCFPVMVQLRPHLTLDAFLKRVHVQRHERYQLAFVEDAGRITAVAGFRIMEMLAHGRILYVDDLVTDEGSRSKGYGDALIDWLVEFANAEKCDELQLDSGVQRFRAHAFYFRERMHISAYHFALKLKKGN
jgi:GNAT superfamily N-acetyltransferase